MTKPPPQTLQVGSVVTPSIDAPCFTAGQPYPVVRVWGYSDGLATVLDNLGHKKYISNPLTGERCAHLWPRNCRGTHADWIRAGHWKLHPSTKEHKA